MATYYTPVTLNMTIPSNPAGIAVDVPLGSTTPEVKDAFIKDSQLVVAWQDGAAEEQCVYKVHTLDPATGSYAIVEPTGPAYTLVRMIQKGLTIVTVWSAPNP